MDLAVDLAANVATLEVRISNADARRLYERFGFRPVGYRLVRRVDARIAWARGSASSSPG